MSLNGEEVASTHDQPMKTDNPQPVRSSSRERTFREKGLEMHKQEAIKHKKEFMRAYGSWKEVAGKVRTALKSFCSQDELNKIREEIQIRHNAVSECYEPIQRKPQRHPRHCTENGCLYSTHCRDQRNNRDAARNCR